MISTSPKAMQPILKNIEHSVNLAKRLRCLNMFITETFDDAIAKASKLSTSEATSENGKVNFFDEVLV